MFLPPVVDTAESFRYIPCPYYVLAFFFFVSDGLFLLDWLLYCSGLTGWFSSIILYIRSSRR